MRLVASDLTLERGGRLIFSHLSFTLEGGQALVITGANGAGKSTLLRALAGLLRPLSGTIALDPQEEASRVERTHYVGHADALKNMLTLSENLNFWGGMLSAGKAGTTLEAALATFGLKRVADLPATYLSAGQRRRAALSRLLLAPRPLWLLDEPLTALDVASQSLLREIMQTHLRDGGMIVAATHAPLGIEALELKLGNAA